MCEVAFGCNHLTRVLSGFADEYGVLLVNVASEGVCLCVCVYVIRVL